MGILICGMMAVPCWREARCAQCNHSNPFAWGRLRTAPAAGRRHSGAGAGEPGLGWAGLGSPCPWLGGTGLLFVPQHGQAPGSPR